MTIPKSTKPIADLPESVTVDMKSRKYQPSKAETLGEIDMPNWSLD